MYRHHSAVIVAISRCRAGTSCTPSYFVLEKST